MCVFYVYLLCIYKHTQIQYIFRKHLYVFACLYLYNSYNLFNKYINITYYSEIYTCMCVCVYMYIYIYIYI